MKITLSWLKNFLDTNATLDQILDTLTMIGLEVEEIDDKATRLRDFEVAEIIEAKPHPDAQKLQVCKVMAGKGELQIVCGAPNARAGIKVVLANVGTQIPNGEFKIKKSQIRSVDSEGMLCSADELNLGEDSDGIIELPLSAKVGDLAMDYLGANDVVIDINITPNRADCLGVYGIARDLAAAGIGQLKPVKKANIVKGFTSSYNIKVNAGESCPLFTVREITELQNAQSPDWLKALLKNVGINPVSAIVDITNYIAHSFSQPLHAYDAGKIVGGLRVAKLADYMKEGAIVDSNFAALNGKNYRLHEEDLVIYDDQGVQCLAGVIGSAQSACDINTGSILLEAAIFKADDIRKTAKRHMIETDSKYRFERHVDSNFTKEALNLATEMIVEICGGQASSIMVYGAPDESRVTVTLSLVDFVKRIGTTDITLEVMESILAKLGFSCELDMKAQTLRVSVPSWRADVTIKEDLIEEVVRIYGYDKITQEPLSKMAPAVISKNVKSITDLKRIMAKNAYNEVVSWSFMDSEMAVNFTSLQENLYLENPISAELNYMRPSIIPNLLTIAHKNLNRSINDLSLFELGPVFLNDQPEIVNHLAAIRVGHNSPKNPHGTRRLFDAFDIKEDVAEILSYYNLDINKCRLDKTNMPDYYHPTRSAAIYLGKSLLGYFGQIHPVILQRYKIEKQILALEVHLNSLPTGGKRKSSKKEAYIVSNYQPVTRDYAFIVDKSYPVGEILNSLSAVDKLLIKNVELFDIYHGEHVPDGKLSLAISVTLQDNNKTMDEQDLNIIHNKIIQLMEQKYAASLRSE